MAFDDKDYPLLQREIRSLAEELQHGGRDLSRSATNRITPMKSKCFSATQSSGHVQLPDKLGMHCGLGTQPPIDYRLPT
jgi:hypothetical protein